jgi:predicted amidohydrolase YtcJ
MPGIIESHIHLFGGSVELSCLMINDIKGLSAVSDSIHQFAKSHPDDAVIIAYGASLVSLGDDVAITRQALDQIMPDRPMALYCFDHHTMWANTWKRQAFCTAARCHPAMKS